MKFMIVADFSGDRARTAAGKSVMSVEVLQQSMAAKGIPFAAQNRTLALLALLAPMHRDIITRP